MSFSLKPYNTFGLDVRARDGIVVRDFAMFPAAFDKIRKNGTGFITLGHGSDVLFKGDYDGTVIVNRLMGVEFNEDANTHYVKAQAGETFHDIVALTMKKGIYGLENLAMIPGTVGGAPVQNIGAYGVSLSDFCRYVEVLDLVTGKVDRIMGRDCGFGYRTSVFRTPENQARYIITAVELAIPKDWKPETSYSALSSQNLETPEAIFDFVCSTRKIKLPDPKVLGNAGSFFRNPVVPKETLALIQKTYENVPHYPAESNPEMVKLAAGWLIDQAGCRGLNLGTAGTYRNQALVLVNYGGATPDDLVNAAKHVQSRVEDTFGVHLDPEVRIYGEKGECQL